MSEAFRRISRDQDVSMARKTQQAWIYPDNKIQRASSKYINGRKYVDPKSGPDELPRRRQVSHYSICINTNKCVPNFQRPDAIRRFEQAVASCFTPETLSRIIEFGPVDKSTFGADDPDDVVSWGELRWEGNVEFGPKQHRMHGHYELTIHHFSQIYFRGERLQREFKAKFNATLPAMSWNDRLYLHGLPNTLCVLKKGRGDVMRRYALKDLLPPL